MTNPTPYACFSIAAAKAWLANNPDPKHPHLTLITPNSTPPKTRNPKMKPTPELAAKKTQLAAVLANAVASEAPTRNSPIFRKMANFKLADHVGMVHNALEAVRSLAISSGTGFSPNGYQENLENVSRNHFVDLLEIINDRLGVALELDDLS